MRAVIVQLITERGYHRHNLVMLLTEILESNVTS